MVAALTRRFGPSRTIPGSSCRGDLHVETSGGQHVFQVQLYLDELAVDAVRVELYADGQDGDAPVWQEMVRGEPLIRTSHGSLYGARVPATRPVGDYTPRVVPYHPAAMIPLEAAQILWQR
jgi:starch phosphorylase